IDGFSTSLDNVNSFKSILRHENKHQVNNENKVPNNNLTHAEVYLYQMKHAEFKDAPTEFQSKMVGSFWNYLYNAEKSKYGDAMIEDLVIRFNRLETTGYKIKMNPNPMSGIIRVEDFDIYNNGKKQGKIKFRLNEEN